MKRFCVIGLGNFGFHVARALYEGHEVVAIDTDREKVQRIQDHASYAILGDAANKEFLKGQGIAEMDAVVVSTGERSHLSTLITLYLKELKVPRILVKALDEDHGPSWRRSAPPTSSSRKRIWRSKPPAASPVPTSWSTSRWPRTTPSSRRRRRPISSAKTSSNSTCGKKFNVNIIGIKDVLTDEFTVSPAGDPRDQGQRPADPHRQIDGRGESLRKVVSGSEIFLQS